MNDPRSTSSPPPLLWSRQGQICCAKHAPFPMSDTWRDDGWRRMSDTQVAAFAARTGMPTECETCRAVRQRAAEARR